MSRKLDLMGKKFGKLTAVKDSGKRPHKKVLWLCLCECGNECLVLATRLNSGSTRSCGCLIGETAIRTNTTHGLSRSKTYKIWASMKRRCNSSRGSGYRKYRARGIRYCERWKTFDNFLEDMGECPDGYSIERIDYNGNYEPDNCKWLLLERQARNRRSNVLVSYKGETKMIIEWAEILNMKYTTLYCRLYAYGWPVEMAFETPVIPGQKVGKYGNRAAPKKSR